MVPQMGKCINSKQWQEWRDRSWSKPSCQLVYDSYTECLKQMYFWNIQLSAGDNNLLFSAVKNIVWKVQSSPSTEMLPPNYVVALMHVVVYGWSQQSKKGEPVQCRSYEAVCGVTQPYCALFSPPSYRAGFLSSTPG